MGWLAMRKNEGIVGDSAWDLGDKFLEDLTKIYSEQWDRPPSRKEIISIIEFCMMDDFEEMYEVECGSNLYDDMDAANNSQGD